MLKDKSIAAPKRCKCGRCFCSFKSAGEIKEGLIISHMKRSQIHFASLRSVLFPFCGLVCFFGGGSKDDIS